MRGKPTHFNPCRASSRTPSGPTSSSARSEAIRMPRFSRDTSIASNSGPAGRSRTSPTSSVSSRNAANCAAVDSWRGTTLVSGNFAVKRANARGSTSGSNSSGMPSRMTLPPSVVNSAIVASAWSRRASTARASARSVIPASVGCHAGAAANQQFDGQLAFEVVDCLRQRGLADMQAARGGREPALFDDRDECGEFTELHVTAARNASPTPPCAELIAAIHDLQVVTEERNPTMDDTYDVIVIGAGPVGQNVTERSRAAGLSVAVVERELVGGECSYWGCVPSKALLRPVLAVADARKVDGAREAVGGSDQCRRGVRQARPVYDELRRHRPSQLGQGDRSRPDPRTRQARRPASGCRRHPRRRDRDADGPARGGHLHRQHSRAARSARYRRGAAVDQPAGDRQQLGARPVGGRRRRRCRRRNGHGVARFGLRGHAARSPVGRAAADGAVRRRTGRRVASRRRV